MTIYHIFLFEKHFDENIQFRACYNIICWENHFQDISFRKNLKHKSKSHLSKMKITSSLCPFLEIHAIRKPFNICKEGCWFSGRFVTLLITWWRWYLICVKIRKFAPTWRHRFWHAQNSPKFENEGLIKISKHKKYVFRRKIRNLDEMGQKGWKW